MSSQTRKDEQAPLLGGASAGYGGASSSSAVVASTDTDTPPPPREIFLVRHFRQNPVAVASNTVIDLDDIPVKFLMQHGVPGVAWSCVRACEHTESMCTAGISEATHFRVKLQLVSALPPIVEGGPCAAPAELALRVQAKGAQQQQQRQQKNQERQRLKTGGSALEKAPSLSSPLLPSGSTELPVSPARTGIYRCSGSSQNALKSGFPDNNDDDDDDDEQGDMSLGCSSYTSSNENSGEDDDGDGHDANSSGDDSAGDRPRQAGAAAASPLASRGEALDRGGGDAASSKKHQKHRRHRPHKRREAPSANAERRSSNHSPFGTADSTGGGAAAGARVSLSSGGSGSSNSNMHHARVSSSSSTSSNTNNNSSSSGTGSGSRGGISVSSALAKARDAILRLSGLDGAKGPQPGDTVPPATIVVKHYDTSEVKNDNGFLRLARFAVDLTAEAQMANEKFFYTVARPIIYAESHAATSTGGVAAAADGSNAAAAAASSSLLSPETLAALNGEEAFRAPHVYFIAEQDRGAPNCLKYICCRCGSGSTVSIGLEDLSRDFSFAHVDGEGLASFPIIQQCVAAMARLHTVMWGRPTADARFLHAPSCHVLNAIHHFLPGSKLIHLPSKFDGVDLCELAKEWGDYFEILQLKAVLAAAVDIQENWKAIRARAVELLQRKQTMLHGDFHFKNIAIRHAAAGTLKQQAATATATATPAPTSSSSASSAAVAGSAVAAPSTPAKAAAAAPVFSTDGRSDICAVDYQGFGAGSPAVELAYFIGTSLPCEVLATDQCNDPILYLCRLKELARRRREQQQSSRSASTDSGGGGGGSMRTKNNNSGSSHAFNSSSHASNPQLVQQQQLNISHKSTNSGSSSSHTPNNNNNNNQLGSSAGDTIITTTPGGSLSTGGSSAVAAAALGGSSKPQQAIGGERALGADSVAAAAAVAPRRTGLLASQQQVLSAVLGDEDEDNFDDEDDDEGDCGEDDDEHIGAGPLHDDDQQQGRRRSGRATATRAVDRVRSSRYRNEAVVVVSADSFGANPLRTIGMTSSRPVTPATSPQSSPHGMFPPALTLGASVQQQQHQNSRTPTPPIHGGGAAQASVASPGSGRRAQFPPTPVLVPNVPPNSFAANLPPVAGGPSLSGISVASHSSGAAAAASSSSPIGVAAAAVAGGGWMLPVSSNAAAVDFTQFAVFEDMRRFDRHVVALYWQALSPEVRRRGWDDDVNRLQAEVDTMVDNWAAMILLDMAKSTVAERKQQKTTKDLQAMLLWAERTTCRVLFMAAARRWEKKRTPSKNRLRSHLLERQQQQQPPQLQHNFFKNFDLAPNAVASSADPTVTLQ